MLSIRKAVMPTGIRIPLLRVACRAKASMLVVLAGAVARRIIIMVGWVLVFGKNYWMFSEAANLLEFLLSSCNDVLQQNIIFDDDKKLGERSVPMIM